MGSLSALTPTEVQAIADALVSATPPPTDGPTLYANNCAGCHGPLATSSKLNRSASQIQGAIDADAGGMNYLSVLTPTEVQAIADALVSGTPPTTGEELYDAYCLACHGPRGTGGLYEDVTGEDAGDITRAIAEEPLMNAILLNSTQIQAIADYLSGN
jgi:mono/diheme cytochrome c family protein